MKLEDYGLRFTISGLGRKSWPIVFLKSWLVGRTVKKIRISKHGHHVGMLSQGTHWIYYPGFPSGKVRSQEFLDRARGELFSYYPEIRKAA